MAVTQKNDKFLKKAFDRAIKLAGYAKDKLNAALVKPSASNLDIGDIVVFNYTNRLGGYTGWRMALVVRPVEFVSTKGNLLLSCVHFPSEMRLTPENLQNLYINRASQLPKDNYRTFIANSTNMPQVYKLKR